MLIYYGTGGGRAVLGEAGHHKCPACEKETDFSAVVDYRYAHVWFLLSFLTGRSYYVVCNNCSNATPVDAKATRAQFPRDNIPFIRKRGWMVVLGVIGFFVLAAMVSSYRDSGRRQAAQAAARARKERTPELVASPQVGDLYIANLASIEGSGFETDPSGKKLRNAYAPMLLTEIEDDDLTFATAFRAWELQSKMLKELDDRPDSFKYDHDDLLYLTREQVQSLFKKNVITEVRR